MVDKDEFAGRRCSCIEAVLGYAEDFAPGDGGGALGEIDTQTIWRRWRLLGHVERILGSGCALVRGIQGGRTDVNLDAVGESVDVELRLGAFAKLRPSRAAVAAQFEAIVGRRVHRGDDDASTSGAVLRAFDACGHRDRQRLRQLPVMAALLQLNVQGAGLAVVCDCFSVDVEDGLL